MVSDATTLRKRVGEEKLKNLLVGVSRQVKAPFLGAETGLESIFGHGYNLWIVKTATPQIRASSPGSIGL